MKRTLLLVALVLPCVAVAQEQFTRAIEDNSFFIEEAYNQERRVVQHINNAIYQTTPVKNLAYTFTQEWPLWGEVHQLSYTVPYQFVDGGTSTGLGDVLVNYRYQLFGKEWWAAVAPRLSVILPSGNPAEGRGSGGVGLQVSLPASKRLSNAFVAHLDFGLTVTPRAKGYDGGGKEVVHSVSSYGAGTSIIWLAAPSFNVMLECLVNSLGGIDQRGNTARTFQTVISPGVRFAIEVESLEIVPGLGIPLFVTGGAVTAGAFIYLSFEHPF